MLAGVAQPTGLAGEPQQRLQHRHRDDLRVADPRHDPHPGPGRHPIREVFQQIISTGIQCGRKGVQVGVHENLRFDVG